MEKLIKKELGYSIVRVNNPFSAYWGEWIKTNAGSEVLEWHPIPEAELLKVRGR